jgi:diaminopimelate decarboxylase
MPAASPVLPHTADRDAEGRLTVGGLALADLAARFGTPALIVDEQGLRVRAREYLAAFRARHPRTHVAFASKAFPCSAIVRVVADEGLWCDVASAGELAIALAGGMPPERVLLHGNAKTDEDLRAALDAGVGTIVIDSADDVRRLRRIAPAHQRVLVRVNPAVPATTHASVSTGDAGSKFGVPLAHAPALIAELEAVPGLELAGLHVHIGSQLTDLAEFEVAVRAIAGLGRFPVYDLGGGLALAYRAGDSVPTVDAYAETIVGALHEHLDPAARLIVEPGRSLTGRSCVTLYEVVTVKRGVRTHVAVDGGMADNLEPMLYDTAFEPAILDADRPPERCELVGPHCESGDVLAGDIPLAAPMVGDLVVVPATGAYCYSLSNNYNGARRPPVVLVRDGAAVLAVRRERIADLLARDCPPVVVTEPWRRSTPAPAAVAAGRGQRRPGAVRA